MRKERTNGVVNVVELLVKARMRFCVYWATRAHLR